MLATRATRRPSGCASARATLCGALGPDTTSVSALLQAGWACLPTRGRPWTATTTRQRRSPLQRTLTAATASALVGSTRCALRVCCRAQQHWLGALMAARGTWTKHLAGYLAGRAPERPRCSAAQTASIQCRGAHMWCMASSTGAAPLQWEGARACPSGGLGQRQRAKSAKLTPGRLSSAVIATSAASWPRAVQDASAL